MVKIASLFSGIGGFEKGFLQADPNTEIVFSSEIGKYPRQIYTKNYGVEPHGNITKINAADVPDHDILVAGVPCQSWSIAGKRCGFEDNRGIMWYEVFRILKEKKPKIALLENVVGLLSHDGGKSFEIICKELNGLGYIVNMEIYNSKDFGVPQNRRRVFLTCTNIREITNAGRHKRMTLSETVIQEWLFQILLNNLEEVVELQDHESKDLVLGCLLLNELATGLSLRSKYSLKTKTYLSKRYPNLCLGENILQSTINQDFSGLREKHEKGITLMVQGEKSSTLDTVLVWQNIDILLKRNWEENYLGKNRYTISTAIKQITEWETFTYSQMLLSIFTLIGQLRNSSNPLWSQILSNLTVIRKGTNYAKVNYTDEKEAIAKSDNHHDSNPTKEMRARVFIIGHPTTDGRDRSKIFPITTNDRSVDDVQEQTTNCLTSRYERAQATGSYIIENKFDAQGMPKVAKCLTGGGHSGGLHSDMTCIPCHSTLPRNSKSGEGGTGHLQRNDGITYCIDAANNVAVEVNQRIRRLTPIECERLQGFPDNWTEGISNTERYKCLGNAVTVPVIEFLARRIFKMLDEIN